MKTLLRKIFQNLFLPNEENAQKFLTWIKLISGTAAAQQYFQDNNINSAAIIAGIGFVLDIIISSSQSKN